MKASILGGSGYVGGELIRLLVNHPNVELEQVTSNRFSGYPVTRVHPNLLGRTNLKFSNNKEIEECDVLFSALPHGKLLENFKEYETLADKFIDLSSDFRLRNNEDYEKWYGRSHSFSDYLDKFVYGLPEIHRKEIKNSDYVSCGGCNATVVILSLYPLFKNEIVDLDKPVVSEAKCGSSEGGNKCNPGSHHPERSGCVRSYKPTGHRHTAEMAQELNADIDFSATSIEMVRGILSTSHVYSKDNLQVKDIWKTYRKEYQEEPFIRIIKKRTGIYRYPEPKLLQGTNFCDIGFETDKRRVVVIGAIDNLMKGAAGQAIQNMNIMFDFNETYGLEFTGLHPV